VSTVVIAETYRRNVLNVAFMVYVVLTALISVGSGSFTGAPSSMAPFITLLTLIIGCRIIGPEFSSGTLQLILAKPINRSTYLVSRVIGTALSIWTAIVVVGAANVIGRAIGHHDLLIDGAALSMLNLAADTLLVIALLALFGSVTRSYFNVALYIVLQLGLAVSHGAYSMIRMAKPVIAEALAFVPKVIVFLQHNLFADAPMEQFSSNFLFLAVSNAAITVLAACFFFRQREVPYGAD
jgi:ABC-type transport system involved in multi-copper enzyme maturation permease subunit